MRPGALPEPTEAIISVTNRCDARCTMCSIWQLPRDEFLGADDYRRCLPTTLRNVNVTGGEALLRPDIVEVVHAIHEGGGAPRIVLATNGFRPERTLATIEQIRRHVPRLAVAVSIDGDARTHDRMRGVPRAYARAVRTLEGLRDIGVDDVRIGFTATKDNLAQLGAVHDLANRLGVQFSATIAQNSDVYYATAANETLDPDLVREHFGDLIGSRLRSRSPKDWLRAYFDRGVIEFVRSGQRMTPCSAASDFFYLSPRGDVYPCLTLPRALGNVRVTPFASLWAGHVAATLREEVARCRECWMMCTARTELRRRPFKVAAWIAKSQAARVLVDRGRAAGEARTVPR